MSRLLITISEAMAALRIDEAYPDLELKTEAASSLVLNFMGSNGEFLTDSAGDVPQDSSGPAVTVPPEIKMAVIVTLMGFYDHTAKWDMSRLPPAAMSLLHKYYDPRLA